MMKEISALQNLYSSNANLIYRIETVHSIHHFRPYNLEIDAFLDHNKDNIP